MEVADLYSPLKEHTSKRLGENLFKFWKEEEKRFFENEISRPNLFRAIARCFWKRFLFIGFFQAFTELVIRFVENFQFYYILPF